MDQKDYKRSRIQIYQPHHSAHRNDTKQRYSLYKTLGLTIIHVFIHPNDTVKVREGFRHELKEKMDETL